MYNYCNISTVAYYGPDTQLYLHNITIIIILTRMDVKLKNKITMLDANILFLYSYMHPAVCDDIPIILCSIYYIYTHITK